MTVKGSYSKPKSRSWNILKNLLPEPETLAEFFEQAREHPARLGPIHEIGVQPLIHFGTQTEEVELRGENFQTMLLLHLFGLVVKRLNRPSEKETKLIPTFTALAQEAGIHHLRGALQIPEKFRHVTLALSAAMVVDTFENLISRSALAAEGFDAEMIHTHFIEKGWNPYQWQGSFLQTARYFAQQQAETARLLPLGPLVDFTGLLPAEGEVFKRWSRVLEASLLHRPSHHPDVQHVDWVWQHPAYIETAEQLRREERESLLSRIAYQLESDTNERNQQRAKAMQAVVKTVADEAPTGLAALVSQLDTRLSVTETHQKKEAVFFEQWQATAKLFPYLRPLMSEFTLNLDRAAAMRLSIGRAAIDPHAQVIYLNKGNIEHSEWSGDLPYLYPLLLLKIALGHHERVANKDAFLWDVASEILLMAWLSQANVFIPEWVQRFPELETLPSVEAIYLRLLEWPKKELRKLETVRGPASSLLSTQELNAAEQAERDAALLGRVREGVQLAQAMEGASWGDHGAGLERALKARAARAVPWKPAFAEYLQGMTPTSQRERTYAKLSRRIRHREEPKAGRRHIRQDDTHNLLIIVDTSGSMSNEDLEEALGTIRATASALNINAIRLFACDAQVRDYGWEAPWHAGGQVVLHGGGGTNLDPALQLIAQLTQDGELLPDQPLLVIADGLFYGEIRTAREHAYLLPKGAALGYRTVAPVFHVQRDE